MEPFAIQCATCKARLKVRDYAAIGQILACPKCGSMVQVQPPADWVPSADGGASTDAPAGTAIQSSPGPTPEGLDPATTIRMPALRNLAAGAGATAAPISPPGGSGAPGESAAASPDSSTSGDSGELAGEGDWLAPHRRWQRWILATAVGAILLLGVLVGFFERSRRQTATRELQPNAIDRRPPRQNVERPANHSLPNSETPVDVAPPTTPVVDQRWMPRDARLVWSFRFSSAAQSAATRAWFEYLYPLWAPVLGPVHETMPANSNRLTGFTWIASDLDNWNDDGLAVLEFQDRLPTDRPLVDESKALEVKLHDAVIYTPPQGTWPNPYVVVGERTLLVGPEELLVALAQQGATPNVPPAGASVAAAPAGEAKEKASEKESAAEEDSDAASEEIASDSVAEEPGAEPQEPRPADEPPAAQAVAAADTPPVLWKLPSKHDFVLAVALGGDEDGYKSWFPGLLSLPALTTEQAPWNLVQSAQLSLDALETYTSIKLSLTCENEAAASQLEKQLRQQLTNAQKKLAEILAMARSGEQEQAHPLAGLAKLVGDSELANSARIIRERTVVRIQTQAQEGLAEVGIAALRASPAIDRLRQPAALAMGEPRLANLAQGLSRSAEAEQTFPAAAAGSAILPAEARLSWIATLLAFYGHEDWQKSLKFARSWQDAENQPITRQPLAAAINPVFSETTTPEGYPVSHYVGISGVGADAVDLPPEDKRAGVFGNQPRRAEAVRDGTSNTIAVMGVRERWGPWSAGGPSTVRPITADPVVNGPDGFGTGQADGMLVGMADGSVRFLSSKVDPRVVQQLATINGGEANAIASLDPVTAPKIEPSPDDDAPAPGENPMPMTEEPVAADAPSAGGGLRSVDVAERLKDPLRSLQVERMPLAQFLELVDSLSTLAIAIDFDQIAIPRAAQLPISVRTENATLGAMLEQALAEHGLVFVADGDKLLIRGGDADLPAAPVSYDVADLLVMPAGSKPVPPDAPHPLIRAVQQLIAPATWDVAGGKGTARLEANKLLVEQSPLVQRQIAELFDRVRAARGKSKLPPTEVQARLTTPWTAIESKLELPLSVNFLDGTRLTRILSYLRDKTGIDFVVDWPALSALKTGPDAVTGLHIQNQPLSAALEALLMPLGLAYRPIDAQTIQITTPAKLNATSELDFYLLRPLPTAGNAADVILERLHSEVSPESWKGNPPAAAAIVDPGSRYLIVRASSPVQKEVGKAVQQWHSAAPRPKGR